jgi:hypothetical protein
MKHFISYLTLILSILLGFVQTTTTRARQRYGWHRHARQL